MTPRETRQLTAIHRGTRQAHARSFLRCESTMISMIDNITMCMGTFGLRFVLVTPNR